MQIDTMSIIRKLDEATSKIAPGGERPPPYETTPVNFSYGELMMIWGAMSLRDAVREVCK